MPPGKRLAGRRVLIVIDSLELGGAERQAIHLARYLRDCEGAVVEIRGVGTPGKAAELCDRHHLRWEAIPLRWNGRRAERLSDIVAIARRFRRWRPDVLLPFCRVPSAVCGLVWRWTGARSSLWNQRDEGRDLGTSRLEHRAMRNVRRVMCNSQHGAAALARIFGLPEREIRVVPNGVELEPPEAGPAEWRSRLGVDEPCFLACMVANIHRYKDHATVLRAWRRVVDRLDQQGREAVLLLAGRLDEPAEPKSLAFDLDLGRRVRFLGHVKDISGLLGAVDLGLFSSQHEGCPNGVLECMAAGLPVVATDYPGIREALGDDASLLVPPCDDAALAERIVELAGDPARRAALGRVNRGRIETAFSRQAMGRRVAEILSELLE